jgi:pyruvate ferredoxin oxidoreductase delta subunit
MAHLTVEVVYRGIFQKNLAARITRGIVLSSRKAGRWGIAFGRYGDSPQRNGIPAKDFAIVADTKEELEQHMARYEPKELHVTICVDDTLCKGVESWAWYGLQPINRLLTSGGHLLVTSTRSPSELLRDIHKKDLPYHMWILPGKASFSGLWVFKEDHTEARLLGALAKIASEFLTIDAVCAAIREAEWGSELKAESARKAYERAEGRRVQVSEGNDEVPFSFEMPKWWEMREGLTIPAIPVGKPVEGGKGYRPERNPYFKKFTTRTMRPVVNFDTCVKCTLCWIQCPDSVFDVTPDGLYDANMDACCGCGVCEAVCPVKDCITMVNEASFEDNQSQWEMWRQGKDAYQVWANEKIRDKVTTVRSHGFRYRGQYEEELSQGPLELGGTPVIEGIPGENAKAKGVKPTRHMHDKASIVTGVPEAPGA